LPREYPRRQIVTTTRTRDANNVARFTIMSYAEFRTECINRMHPLHAGIVATSLAATIDELINDAYTGEIDDLNESTPDAFARWIDHAYNWIN
jgi:hypothetical protein